MLCFGLGLPVAAQGVTRYVAPDGDDGNPGTELLPWKTINHAAQTLVAGDTVLIKAGTYEEQVVPLNSGSPGHAITYAAYSGDEVVIDGQNITLPGTWGGLFEVAGKSYITVSSLIVQNAGPEDNHAGILIDGCSWITIEGCRTYNTVSSGIGVWGSSDITLTGNEIEAACNDGEQECLTVAGTDGFEVVDCHVHHGGPGSNGGEGIDIKDGSANGRVAECVVHDINRSGIYVDAWDKHTHHIVLEGNTVFDTQDFGFYIGSEQGGLLEDIQILNNIAYHNLYVGLGLHNCCIATHPVRHVRIVNNTVFDNGWTGGWGGGILNENGQLEEALIRNNIVSDNNSFQIADEAGIAAGDFVVDHNLIEGFRGYPGETLGTEAVTGDPRFVDENTGDFHLQSDSPAIDQGSSVEAPLQDFDGNLRNDGAVDIGCFEYQGNCTATFWTYLSNWCTAAQPPTTQDLNGNGLIDLTEIIPWIDCL